VPEKDIPLRTTRVEGKQASADSRKVGVWNASSPGRAIQLTPGGRNIEKNRRKHVS